MKFIVKVEVEVVDTESPTEAKKAAYDLAATLNAPKRGRRTAGAQASVVGITVEEERPNQMFSCTSLPGEAIEK